MTRTRRDEIVDAALELFAARGYQGASIDAIAQRVGLTRQGVLHYFPGKEKLLVEVLRRREELARAHLRSDYAEEDLPDQMAHVVAHDHERVGLTQVYSVLLGESITEGHPAQGYFRDHYAAVRARMADSFTERWGERLPSGLTPRAAATALLALLDGMQQQWLLAPEQDDHPEIIRDVLTVLLGEDSGARHRADRSAGHGEGRGGGQGGGQGGEPAEEPVEEQRDEHAARQGRGQGGEPVRERAEENAGRQGGERIRERREEQGGEPVREPRDEPGGRQSAGPVSERREEHRGEQGAEPVREHPDEPGGRQGGHPGRGRFGATSTVPAATSAEEPPPGQ
ncbi:MAG TPA: TetR family transcriptional regulator, partial [Yinghuangia sp.]|nr:TetR family transcriptional regulator [Yinghuangia sp.]